MLLLFSSPRSLNHLSLNSTREDAQNLCCTLMSTWVTASFVLRHFLCISFFHSNLLYIFPRTGRIGVHEGDDPALLARNFAASYRLDDFLRQRLEELIQQHMDAQAIPYEPAATSVEGVRPAPVSQNQGFSPSYPTTRVVCSSSFPAPLHFCLPHICFVGAC